MPRRILAALALVALTASPVLAQEAEETTKPLPAPGVQTAPEAADSNLQTEPKLITPARKSDCSHSRQVMS